VAVLALFTIGFGLVYLLKPRHWWALIPAGLFLTSAVSVLLTDTPLGLADGTAIEERVVGVIFFAGFALTFLVLWLRRHSVPTTWAVYPALVFGLLAVVTIAGGENGVNTFWPLIFIAGGLLILYRSYSRRMA
jgi:peptidoglycan/LPS O-acetylase OafA/YrhL